MAFSGSSYFAGIGTVLAAIAFGVACGSMVTTSVVQPPNRLERVNGATDHSKRGSTPLSTASSSVEQASTAKPASQEAPPSPVVAVAPSVPAAEPQPAPAPRSAAPQPEPPALAAAKTDTAATTVQDQPTPAAPTTKSPASPTAAKSEDSGPAKNERANGHSADSNKGVSRKKAGDRKFSNDRRFSERWRRQDQDGRRQDLDEATDAVRRMPRGGPVDEIVEDDAPRFEPRPHRFGLFGDDESPHVSGEPRPRFGFFGFGD